VANGLDYFLELDIADISARLEKYIESGNKIKIWNSKGKEIEVSLVSFTKDYLEINPEKKVIEDFYYVNMHIHGMAYYCKANLRDETHLHFVSPLYRAEKRTVARFMMYPRHSAYINFEGFDVKGTSDNVLSINTFNVDDDSQFKEFEESLEKISDVNDSYIIDISRKGLAFVCSNKMANSILATKPQKATVIIEQDRVPLEDVVFIHDNDFKQVRAEGVYQTKIGVRFKESRELERILMKYDDNSWKTTTVDEEFQEFIDNIDVI
jgi:hypothetical protein